MEVEDAFMGNSSEEVAAAAAAAIGSLLVDASSLWLGIIPSSVGSLEELTLRSICEKKWKCHFKVGPEKVEK